ncbi:MAG TPA: BamA/TamA family outer membrane protein [Gemmatimonadota bacterium]|nr:BamA/TamA family outer membrane protein [Gemmatimonadota bacterium]
MPVSRTIQFLCALALVFVPATALLAQAPAVELDPRLPTATARILRSALESRDALVTGEDTTIERGALHLGSIVQIGGRLLIEGRVTDDVVAVGSEVTLRPGAEIGGDLTVLGGMLNGSTMAQVRGRQTWLREEPVRVDRTDPDRIYVAYEARPAGFPIEPKGIWGIVVHEYNGVDGLAFGLAAGLKDLPGQPRTELAFGPVFRSERGDVGWDVVALREIPPAGITIGGRVHSITDTHQRWQRGDLANSFLSVVLADDDRTYFERTGYELWGERSFVRWPVTVRLRWRDDEYGSLESVEPFALFDGSGDEGDRPNDGEPPELDEDGWPVNPPIDEGRGRALGLRAAFDSRNVPEYPTRGILVSAQVDQWGFGGDYDFQWGLGDARLWVPLGGRSYAAVRAMGGGLLGDGELPSQFLWRLGGAGSLAGYDALIEPLVGEQMALANVRAHLALPGSAGMFETLYVVALADVGDAWSEGEDPEWRASVGGGLAAHGRLRYVGLFGAYGIEDETWKAVFVLSPWFDVP